MYVLMKAKPVSSTIGQANALNAYLWIEFISVSLEKIALLSVIYNIWSYAPVQRHRKA